MLGFIKYDGQVFVIGSGVIDSRVGKRFLNLRAYQDVNFLGVLFNQTPTFMQDYELVPYDQLLSFSQIIRGAKRDLGFPPQLAEVLVPGNSNAEKRLQEFIDQSPSVMREFKASNLIEYLKIIQGITSTYYNSSEIVPMVFFRGASNNDWNLTPSIFRYSGSIKHVKVSSHNLLQRIMVSFKKRAMPYVNNQNLSDNDWAAIGRHHGLPVNLLDWTTNALIALYFACRSVKIQANENNKHSIARQTEGGAVWVTESTFAISNISTRIEGEFYKPDYSTRFIEAQRGWFSLHPIPEEPQPFEDITEASFPKIWDYLVKILIPDVSKPLILSELKTLGIDESSVFPSLEGIASDIRHELKLNRIIPE